MRDEPIWKEFLLAQSLSGKSNLHVFQRDNRRTMTQYGTEEEVTRSVYHLNGISVAFSGQMELHFFSTKETK